jgi:hypothetical protein
VSCATARALSAPGPRASCRARATRGCGPRPTAGQANSGPHYADLSGAMVEPQQAEHALCAWAELGFGPEAV